MARPIACITQSNMPSRIVFGFVLCIILPLVEILGSPSALWSGEGAKSYTGTIISAQNSIDKQSQFLEQSKRITSELAGGQSNSYQVKLAADQFAGVVVDQHGINVKIKLFGPEGSQLTEFDSEIRLEGEENVSWVAETAGVYRLDVLSDEKNAAAGRYDLCLLELRASTEKDRSLYEANKLIFNSTRLFFAGKIDNAIPLAERSLEIYERVLGEKDRKFCKNLYVLAFFYIRKSDYTKADLLLQRALTILENMQDGEHPDLAVTYTYLGTIKYEIGLNLKAEEYFQRALEIYQKSLGSEHRFIASALHQLAILCILRGDYDQAESLYQRALAIAEKLLGPEDSRIVHTLNNLGLVYYLKKNYTKAELLHRRALALKEKAFGPESPYVANSFNNLADIYREREDYTQAESLYQKALAIWEKSIGSEHPDVAMALFHLATLYHKKGDYAKAEPLYLRSLAIREKILVPEHFNIAESLSGLAELYAAKGEISKAVSYLSRANAICDLNIADNLATGSERQKLAYLSLFIGETNLTLSLQSQLSPNDPETINLALTTLLRRKGRALDAMTDTFSTLRRHARPEDRELLDQLTEARSQCAALSLRDSVVADINNQKNLKMLKDKIDKMEGELSVRIKEFRADTQPVTIKDVQALLPASSALVEFAIYEPQDLQTKRSKPERYIAYLLNEKGDPKWVDIGEVNTIDYTVDAWRNALRDPNRKDVRRLGRELDEKVMRPVRTLLGDSRHLLIAPDGKLNLIPFAALVDENNRYLVERYTISYLTSGRDLLRLRTSQPNKNPPLIVANPDFGRPAILAARVVQTSGSLQARKQVQVQIDQSQIFFQPLPGTEDEALAIKAVLPEATLLLREQSTEAAIKEADAPNILHIATHGFFFNDQLAQPPEMRALSRDKPKQLLANTSSAPESAQTIRYSVQLDSTPDLEAAQAKVKGFRGQKVDAYLVKSKINGLGPIYRVRAGKFSKFSEAQKYLAELLSLGFGSDFFIASYRSPQGDLALPKSMVVSARKKADNSPVTLSSRDDPQTDNEPLRGLRLSKFTARVEDPLLRSGLALAGANQGKSGDKDDGLLTAMEASGLDLLGTKLVVLSACDTGVGDLRTGEGVQGLRRALVLAGSESQVISLWPVPDQSTKDLMVPYYKALRQGEGRSEGLRQVQLGMLQNKEWRHPFYWAAFIQSGEWANLEGKR